MNSSVVIFDPKLETTEYSHANISMMKTNFSKSLADTSDLR